MDGGTAACPDKLSPGSSITAELEETKQSLQKAREDGLVMATCLSSLQEELQKTKKGLQNLRDQQRQRQQQEERADQASSSLSEKHVLDYLEIEDVKFVEESSTEDEGSVFQVDKTETICRSSNKVVEEFRKKRCVTFADPPATSTLPKVAPPRAAAATPGDPYVLQRRPSLRKTEKKLLIPLIKGFFRKRGNSSAGAGPAGA